MELVGAHSKPQLTRRGAAADGSISIALLVILYRKSTVGYPATLIKYLAFSCDSATALYALVEFYENPSKHSVNVSGTGAGARRLLFWDGI